MSSQRKVTLTLTVTMPEAMAALLEKGDVLMLVPVSEEEIGQVRSGIGGLVEFTRLAHQRLGTVLQATEDKAALAEAQRKSLGKVLHMSRLASHTVDNLRMLLGRAQFIAPNGLTKGGPLQ